MFRNKICHCFTRRAYVCKCRWLRAVLFLSVRPHSRERERKDVDARTMKREKCDFIYLHSNAQQWLCAAPQRNGKQSLSLLPMPCVLFRMEYVKYICTSQRGRMIGHEPTAANLGFKKVLPTRAVHAACNDDMHLARAFPCKYNGVVSSACAFYVMRAGRG